MEGISIPGVRQYQQGDDFERWVKAVERYMVAVNITTAERKCALLLHLVGEEIADTYETLADVEGADVFEKCKTKLSNYLSPHCNVIAERMAFQKINMDEGEEFEAYLTRLKKQIRRCGYEAAQESRELRDRCVAGASHDLQQKFLVKAAEKGDALLLEDVRSIAKVHKAVRDLGMQFSGEKKQVKEEVVGDRGYNEDVAVIQSRRDVRATAGKREPKARQGGVEEGERKCFKCGRGGHLQRWCRDQGGRKPSNEGAGKYDRQEDDRKDDRKCFNCGRYGHLQRFCRAPRGGGQTGARTCHACGAAGHLQRWCPKRTAGNVIPEVLMALEAETDVEEESVWEAETETAKGGTDEVVEAETSAEGAETARNRTEDETVNEGCAADDVMKGEHGKWETKVTEEVLEVQAKREDKPPVAKVEINGREMEMLIDTGSPVSIISSQEASQVPGLNVRRTKLKLRSFTGQKLKVIGEAAVIVKHAGQEKQVRVIVCDQPSRMPLLGREWLREIKMDWKEVWTLSLQQRPLTLQAVIAANKEVFEPGLGKMTVEAHLTLKQDAVPKSVPARPIPYALLPKVNEELDRWVQEGIAKKLAPSEKTSGWGTPLVPVPKPSGEVRLCASYDVTVNPQLVVKQHPLPRAEDVFAGVDGQLFCKLDLENAYQQMKLDKESQDMTTVSTHRGLYRMLRLPFGIASCGALFQDAMERILGEVRGCKIYLDDLLVYGKDAQELLQRLDNVLKKLKEHGLRLSKDKCQFMKKEVLYLGWKISGKGISPREKGVEAIMEAPEPSDIHQLRSLLGSINYFAKLLPDLSTILEPLYALTKKGVAWRWTQECREAVNMVKKMLAGPRVLMTYDPELPVKLITDASSVGVGAALLHVLPDGSERPISYASRSLTGTERKYAQVEKEAAAVSYGVSRFHHFIYGRHFTLVTDNRALSRILSPSKGLPSLAAARLQRYALQLATYSYGVELRKSEQMHVADSLSRLSMPCSDEEEREINKEGVATSYIMYMDGIQPLITAERVARETRRDPVLGRVLNYVRHGWPDKTEEEMRAYKRREDELSTDFDCVLWGGRTVIPSKLRAAVLQEIHQGHLGAAKMKNLARRYVWWPGVDSELEATARDCRACTEKKTAPPRAALHPWEPATQAWERVHVDYAGPFQGTYLLIVYDSYTRWIEAVPVRETTAARTVHELRDMCARFGVPAQIVSDNGPQFVSREFTEFAEKNGIRHIKVAPYHQSSNGAAERAVQTVKNALKVSVRDGGTLISRLQRFLLAYRAAPHSTTGRSPAELMLGWQPKTRLDHLQPDLLRRVKDTQQRDVDRKPGAIRTLQVEDNVWVRCYTGRDKWRRGKIRAMTGPRSFEVDMGGGVIWSRHADQLWPANNPQEEGRPAQTPSPPCVNPRPAQTPSPPCVNPRAVQETPLLADAVPPPAQEQQPEPKPTAESDDPPPTEQGPLAPRPRESSPEPRRGIQSSREPLTPTREQLMSTREPLTSTPELPIALRRGRRQIKPPERYCE